MTRTLSHVSLVTTLGTVGTPRPLRTSATTDRGLVAAIRRHVGPVNATLCGGTVVAVEYFDPATGTRRRVAA